MLTSLLRQLFRRRPPLATPTLASGLEAYQAGDLQAAAEKFSAYLVAHPEDADGHINLGAVLQRLGHYPQALSCFNAAARLAPADAAAHYNIGLIHHLQGDVETAERCYRDAIRVDPSYPEAHREYSMLRLYVGDYSPSVWASYRERRRCAGFPLTVSRCPAPLWKGESPAEKTVLTYGEQGLGDEILFASCYPDLIAQSSHCVIETEPRLEELFRRSFPRATVLGRQREAELAAVYPSVSWQAPCGDLPYFYRASAAAFPDRPRYLAADPEKVDRWKRRLAALGPGPKIGISWRGGTARTRQEIRSAPLTHWRPILALPGSQFISLQYGDCASDLEQARNALGVELHHWPEAIADYDETAALVSALDLVISVTTSVVHLAGALGRPVWILANAGPRWCYGLNGGRLPWYVTARLFQQRRLGIWDDVMSSVAERLAAGLGAPLDR
jgi:tetratricopeptide (TPR) repeat protein